MSTSSETIFREYKPSQAERSDRAARDRARHRAKVKQSIKDNLGNVISEESLIGKSGDKLIKVPIRGIKEYSFVYGQNQNGASQGEGNTQQGQVVGKTGQQEGAGQGQGGQEKGEDIYETEVTLNELTELLFEDLNLPDLTKKSLKQLPNLSMRKKDGFRRKGIEVRLDKRKTAINRIKRKIASGKEGLKVECDTCNNTGYVDSSNGLVTCPVCRIRFHEADKRFKHFDIENRPESNAVMICIMDTSGSMDTNKKFLARSLFYLLYLFLRSKYLKIEVVFIAHDTAAQEVDEDNFFHKGESGGTFISSGYEKALEIITDRYNPSLWNVYILHASDGDNFDGDNDKAIKLLQQLLELCNLVGYAEVLPDSYSFKISSVFEQKLQDKKFVTTKINNKEEIWPALKKYLTPEYGESEL
jgi:hypothetical protein